VFSLPSPPEGEQSAQFDDGFRVVVDAKVADPIDAFSGVLRRAKLLHNEGSRLLPSPVTPRSLSRFKRCHHPLGQRPVGLQKCAPHRGKNVGAGQHVSLHREAMLNQVPSPINALAPGERRGTPIRGYSSYLTKLSTTVVSKHLIDRYGRIDVRRERIEDALAISRDDPHRLGRDRTYAGPNPRRDRADREVLRLNCASDFAGRRVSRDNRKRSSLDGHRTTVTLWAPFVNSPKRPHRTRSRRRTSPLLERYLYRRTSAAYPPDT
jgi:hypothetical protein